MPRKPPRKPPRSPGEGSERFERRSRRFGTTLSFRALFPRRVRRIRYCATAVRHLLPKHLTVCDPENALESYESLRPREQRPVVARNRRVTSTTRRRAWAVARRLEAAMKKDVIPEIPEDQRAMFPVDPRILVRRAPSRDFVAILERGVTLVFTRVGVETRFGSRSTAPRAREGTATPRSPPRRTTDAEAFSSNSLAGCGGRGRAPRDARGEPRERDVARRDDAAARRVRRARRGERGVPRRGGFRERARPRALRHHLLPRAEVRATPTTPVFPFSQHALRDTSGRAFHNRARHEFR